MAEKTTSLPFLGSLADTAEMIAQLNEQLAEVERQRRELDEKANDLTVRIAAFNTLRQAHGLAPL